MNRCQFVAAAFVLTLLASASRAEELEQLFLSTSDAPIQVAEELGMPFSSILEVWQVELNDAVLKENRIQAVRLPDEDTSYRVLDGNVQGGVWWASLVDLERSRGVGRMSLVLPTEREEASGSLHTAERFFEIVQVGSNFYLVELSPRGRDRIVEYATFSKSQPPNGWIPSKDCKSALCTGTPTEIDLAIYYSEAVEKSYKAGNVKGEIESLVAAANEALSTSFICVKLNAKLIEAWSGFKVDGSGLHASLRKVIRQKPHLLINQADLAIVLMKTTDCGLAYQFPIHKAGWALVSADRPGYCGLSARQAFAHEVGHLLGADHDREITHPEYAHALLSSKGRVKTLMVEQVESAPFQFSRPPTFGCSKTKSIAGCIELADNACVIRQVAPIIAGYHP